MITNAKTTVARKLTALIMALSLMMVMTGLCALAASAKRPSALSDGEYTVGVQLWHSSKDQASMAASCLKDTADLSVKNGKATMTVHTQPMSMAGITASMQSMSVKQPDGKLVPANVAEKDANGTPTAFSFEVPSDDEYIPVEVNPMLEMLGNEPMDARIKVDWDSVKAVDGSEPAADLISSASKTTESEPEEETATAEATTAPAAVPVPAASGELADGTYTVGVKLWHSEKDQASMAASSLKPEAKIVVNNGKGTMYIYTQPMTFGNITASLQEMKVRMPNGSWEDARVAARSADGNPTSFQFTFPGKSDYITVQVNPHVEMMGNQFLDARIKVDWNSLKTSATAGAEDPNPASAVTTATGSYDKSGTKASGVDTADDPGWAGMGWYAVAVGAMTFALCFAVLKRGLV